MRQPGGERLIPELPSRAETCGSGAAPGADQSWVRPRPIPRAPGAAEAEPLAVLQPEGGQGLAALRGERGHAVVVAGIGEGRHRRVNVAEGQRLPGTADPQVGQETVRFQRQHEAGPAGATRGTAGPGQVQDWTAGPGPDPLGEAAVVLPQQRVDDGHGQVVLDDGPGFRRVPGGHGWGSASIAQRPEARKAATERATAARSGPRAQITPR